MSATPLSGSGRETRILLLVIVVAVAMLLVLAQFRYPGPDRTAVMPITGPIERLAARATFEELALIMADLSARLQPAMTVVVLEQTTAPQVQGRRGAPAPDPMPVERRLVVALRVDVDLAIAYLPAGFAVVEGNGVELAAADPARGLVLVRVTPAPFIAVGPVASAIGGPGYVAVFEGGRGGPAVRPLFLGRVDSFDDPRWSDPPLSIGGDVPVRPGAFIYTLDGRLAGMVTPDQSGVAIARVPALLAAVEAIRPQ